MARLVILSVFILVSSNLVKVSHAGPVAYKQHRDTTLEELRSIDSYVSGALPVLQDGFFIGTPNGPVLVKSEPLPGVNKRPTVRAKYYNTLPRLIPAGFEGIATSHFNLGAASAIQPFSLTKNVASFPVAADSQPRQYFATQEAQPSQQYVAQPAADQSQQIYFQAPEPQQRQFEPQQPQQYVAEAQQRQQFAAEAQQRQQIAVEDQQRQRIAADAQQRQQFAAEAQQNQQYAAEAQQNQQYAAVAHQNQQFATQPYQYHHRAQQFIQPEEAQPLQQQQQQQQQFQQYEHHPDQFLVERQVNPSPQPQHFQQQQQFFPEQDIGQNFPSHAPQSPIESRSEFQNVDQFAAPDAEQTFQIDNLLRSEDPPRTATFQRQLFGKERFQSQRLLPNAEVVEASEFEETLPEPLKNRFYKSANLATILAQESLPVSGEQIVGEWDTHKIAKSKIHALLQGAGLI